MTRQANRPKAREAIMPHPLEAMLQYASDLAGDNRQLAGVVFKELLHYDMLHALSQTPLVDHLVFQGGTALRLCYGGSRYSEDLDFVCPQQLDSDHWRQFEQVLQRSVARNFGCEAILHAPTAGGGEHVAVERRQARRPYLKARDVWDLNWLLQKGVQVDAGTLADKARRGRVLETDELSSVFGVDIDTVPEEAPARKSTRKSARPGKPAVRKKRTAKKARLAKKAAPGKKAVPRKKAASGKKATPGKQVTPGKAAVTKAADRKAEVKKATATKRRGE